jgi:hypothetical protein
MQPKDLNITVENGVKTVEVLIGSALEPKEPEKVEIFGTLEAPLKWLEKRVSEINQKKCHVIVNREDMSILLVIDEKDHYHTSIEGKLQLHPAFLKFGINQGEYRTPIEMSELIKMNRSYFENRQVAMELVSLLRNFKAKIDKEVEADIDLRKGDRRVLVAQKIDSNLPEAFNINVPIFKGQKPRTIECETYFNPNDLTCTLVSPEANDITEEIKDGEIDKVISSIAEVAPDIAIVEI